MKKILIIIISLILIISNAYDDKCYDSDTTPIILDSDKKTGRFFEDQPDVNDDFQVHVVYTLLKDSKDKEGDINGDVEKWVEIADNWILKKTAKANKKSNLDISFNASCAISAPVVPAEFLVFPSAFEHANLEFLGRLVARYSIDYVFLISCRIIENQKLAFGTSRIEAGACDLPPEV